MIEVSHLSKHYGTKKAVDNISFSIASGEIVAFLGPNGAGKSTTMNMLTGYISSTSGSIKIDGHDIVNAPMEAKKRIGYLPELPPLYLDMTLDEFLNGDSSAPQPQTQVCVQHMEDYARYLTARSRRRTALLATALALALLVTAALAVLCADRTFFTGRCESEFLSGVTIPVPRYCLYRGTGGMDEYTVKLKTLRQPDDLDVWIQAYLSTLESVLLPNDPTWGPSVWYDTAQDITILQYRANNDGVGFVNTVYITYHAGRIPGA